LTRALVAGLDGTHAAAAVAVVLPTVVALFLRVEGAVAAQKRRARVDTGVSLATAVAAGGGARIASRCGWR
jgi:hypothetical protein